VTPVHSIVLSEQGSSIVQSTRAQCLSKYNRTRSKVDAESYRTGRYCLISCIFVHPLARTREATCQRSAIDASRILLLLLLYITRYWRSTASHDFRVNSIHRTVGLVVMIAAFHLTDQRQSRVQFPDSSFCFRDLVVARTTSFCQRYRFLK
jgi:hypothetical protein